jgi:hypothetical protein
MSKKNRRRTTPATPNDEDLYTEVREAIQCLVREGKVVDSGERRWSKRTRRYEIVWMVAPTRH